MARYAGPTDRDILQDAAVDATPTRPPGESPPPSPVGGKPVDARPSARSKFVVTALARLPRIGRSPDNALLPAPD